MSDQYAKVKKNGLFALVFIGIAFSAEGLVTVGSTENHQSFLIACPVGVMGKPSAAYADGVHFINIFGGCQ